ncbi:MAG: beta-ketoacyl synthase N-terminal-like domain-containing protein [Sphingobacterium sp.]
MTMEWNPVYIHDINCVTPLGNDLETTWDQLLLGNTGIAKQKMDPLGEIFVAKVHQAVLPDLSIAYTLLERMFLCAGMPVVKNHAPGPRTALVLSTTKGNVDYLKQGDFQQAGLATLATKIAHYLGFQTKPVVVSHACVSGSLAVSVAKRLLQMDLYDDAIILAGDLVNSFVVSGFNAFQAMSALPCRPFDTARSGVSLGEAAACIYMSRDKGPFRILGEGGINDANHISGPSRTGEGLYRSVIAAVSEAQVDLQSIDYLCAHGTATQYNDEMEAIAFDRLGLSQVPVNSLKGYFGHTLGASSLLELVIAMRSMQESIILSSKGFEKLGVSRALNVVERQVNIEINRLLKTSSGFGGSNVAILIEKVC